MLPRITVKTESKEFLCMKRLLSIFVVLFTFMSCFPFRTRVCSSYVIRLSKSIPDSTNTRIETVSRDLQKTTYVTIYKKIVWKYRNNTLPTLRMTLNNECNTKCLKLIIKNTAKSIKTIKDVRLNPVEYNSKFDIIIFPTKLITYALKSKTKVNLKKKNEHWGLLLFCPYWFVWSR